MTQRIIFIQGGGAGYDQEQAVRRILSAAGIELEWQVHEAGLAALEKGQAPLPPAMLAAIRQNGIALKTKLLNPPDRTFANFNVQLRLELGLFAAVRPLHNVHGLRSRFDDVDIVLIREITEDLYTAIEHEIIPGVVQSIKVVTETACRRFFRFAFNYTRQNGRKMIHCIHKANILKMADGLFLDCFRQTAKEFPAIQTKEMIVDNACMQLVSKPQQFDVIAAGNLYGDLLSDLGAGLIGGITTAAGINYGDNLRVYESIHGGSLDAVGGPDRANPLPLLFPALALLKDIGAAAIAARIFHAVERVLQEGSICTADLGGNATTTAMTDAIIAAMTA